MKTLISEVITKEGELGTLTVTFSKKPCLNPKKYKGNETLWTAISDFANLEKECFRSEIQNDLNNLRFEAEISKIKPSSNEVDRIEMIAKKVLKKHFEGKELSQIVNDIVQSLDNEINTVIYESKMNSYE